MEYVGHTSEDGRRQLLSDHLKGTAALCKGFADAFGWGGVGGAIGLAHDIGKYSLGFQDRILRGGRKVDHSTAGGLEIARTYGHLGAYCVMGHHGGLLDGGSSSDRPGNADTGYTLCARMNKRVALHGQPVDDGHIHDYGAFKDEITLPEPRQGPLDMLAEGGFSVSMLIRMLFSCLVDADYLDTERFMSDGRAVRGGFDTIPVLSDRLLEYLKRFDSPATDIHRMRNGILKDCLDMGASGKGLYSLTVPTGGGKTIASLAFALTHAKSHGMGRVIYVIPYTNIIEQTAQVFTGILGQENVLEHHSGFEYNNDENGGHRHHLAAENWDAPVVVTTNVQFFESIFAARTSKYRKLHNIAGSVLIFDEAQMLPMQYLKACTRVIAELVHNFGCTVVLCTATQPALDAFIPKGVARREICRDPQGLYAFFKRVQVRHIGEMSDAVLAERLGMHEEALCIVNTRKQAQNLYNLLDRDEGTFHLSTLMYPGHRKGVLAAIRERLSNNMPCRVVATSLVEAGVDIDFPVVYRAKAGLDSIVQAAGRCNREGRREAHESFVYVFEPDDTYSLPISWRQPAEVMSMIRDKHPGDITSMEAIRDYFKLLYTLKGEALDADGVLEQLERGYQKGMIFPFRTIAERFRLINDNTHTVLIPDNEEAMQYAERLRGGERSRALMRAMGPFCVNVYAHHYRALASMGVVEEPDAGFTRGREAACESGVSILSDMSSYSRDTGLTLEPEGGKGYLA